MKLLTPETLAAALGIKPVSAEPWVNPLLDAQRFADLSSPQRLGSFLAQVSAESGQLTVLVENLNYTSVARILAVFGKRVHPEGAESYVRSPERLANKVYAISNGNRGEASGDGWNYRGRGLIQTTGLGNYRATGEGLGLDLVARPELLEEPTNAAASAAWFWVNRRLNRFADTEDTSEISLRVNGSRRSAPERHKLYERALTALC